MNRLGFTNRYLWFGLIAVGVLCLFLIALAPSNNQKNSGSTFSRAPEGYLGWYTYMAERGTPVQRWQRPPAELLDTAQGSGHTLVQVYADLVAPGLVTGSDWMKDWLAAGNRLVLLGVRQVVTEAQFATQQESSQGTVEVETRRRQTDLTDNKTRLLGDRYGAVVWEQPEGKGIQIFSSTPHLGANAYQDAVGNYAFLAALVSRSAASATEVSPTPAALAQGHLWVNEYMHGYKAADVIVEEVVKSWSQYLGETPVAVAVIQLGCLLAVFILAQNQRWGTRILLKAPVVDNSQAYIQALAAVLRKAGSGEFVVDAIARAERQALQKSLGLGTATISDTALKSAWTQQTGQSEALLMPLLTESKTIAKQPDQGFINWLLKLKQIRQQVAR